MVNFSVYSVTNGFVSPGVFETGTQSTDCPFSKTGIDMKSLVLA